MGAGAKGWGGAIANGSLGDLALPATQKSVSSPHITSIPGNYTAYLSQKVESVAQHWEAHEKQQREISRQV